MLDPSWQLLYSDPVVLGTDGQFRRYILPNPILALCYQVLFWTNNGGGYEAIHIQQLMMRSLGDVRMISLQGVQGYIGALNLNATFSACLF